MRRKLVAGNWKMNLTMAQAIAVAEGFLRFVKARESVDVLICPSFLCINKVREVLKSSHAEVGAQDVFWLDNGAFTGSVSPTMLKDVGARMCIVGHSETRGRFGKLDVPPSTVGYFAETDETVNLKIKALLYHSIPPILCVGETLTEREANATDTIIRAQLDGALQDLDASELPSLVVAYEPVWAIGTGQVCETPEAERICGMIRQHLTQKFGEEVGDHGRVLYGGSVKASNAQELFSQPNIDGGLVGGASLNAEEFSRIVMSA